MKKKTFGRRQYLLMTKTLYNWSIEEIFLNINKDHI
jgi:hypothetical protein